MEPRIGTILLLPLLLLILLAAALNAQEYRGDAAWNVGGVHFGTMNSGAGTSTTTLAPSSGWIVGLQATQWWGSGHVGGRLNGAFTSRPFPLPGSRRNVAVSMADADLVLRFLPAAATRTVSPYVALGGGFVYYGLGAGPQLAPDGAGATYDGKDHVQAAAVGSFGFDVLTHMRWGDNPVGFRLEGTDHMTKSPFKPVAGGDFSAVHNVRVSLGVFSGIGSLR